MTPQSKNHFQVVQTELEFPLTVVGNKKSHPLFIEAFYLVQWLHMKDNNYVDPFTSDQPVGEQKQQEHNVCISCEG